MVKINFSIKPNDLNMSYFIISIPFIVFMIHIYTIHSIFAVLFGFFIHEIGHYIGAKLCGMSVDEIHITLFGGYTDIIGNEISLKENFTIALLGPIFGVLSVIISYPYLMLFLNPQLTNIICFLIIITNLFNYVPMKGSDGYFMLKCVRNN